MLEIVNGELFLNGIPINLKFIKMSDDTGIEIQDKDGNVLIKILEDSLNLLNYAELSDSVFKVKVDFNYLGFYKDDFDLSNEIGYLFYDGTALEILLYDDDLKLHTSKELTLRGDEDLTLTSPNIYIPTSTKTTPVSGDKIYISDSEDGTVLKQVDLLKINGFNRSPIKQNLSISHTGTTAETIISNYLIPAGTFEANDIFRWRAYFTATNNANVKNVRFYTNTSVSLTGAQQLGRRLLTSSAGRSVSRDLVFKNSLSSQETLLVTADIGDDEGATNTALSTRSINFAVDQYFLVTVELANSGDTVTLNWLRSQIFR
jgi:hypothetical protein